MYFWPESFRINGLVRSLRATGCTVTILTGQPNYPEGTIFAGYSALSILEQLHEEGYTIYRVPLVPRAKASALRLIANYASFVIAATLLGPWLLRGQEFDVVFVYAPSPILQAIPAILIKQIKKARLVTWVQDLWPQSLESTGFVKSPTLLRMVERLVRWIYQRHDLLLGQSRSFVASIRELAGGVPVEYFPNPGEAIFDLASDSRDPMLRLDSGFNVVFAGNLGSVQALEMVLDAAGLLRDQVEIRFILIGSGSRSAWLKAEVSRRGLANVQLPGRFAPEEMPPILAQASVLLASLIRNPTMSQTIPAKVQAYLAAGRPIIAALDGEGANVVLEAGAGLVVPAEDAVALSNAVVRLQSASDDERARMGEAGRSFYQRHFVPDVLARQLVDRLQDLVAR
jgi:glycosyltransferase involved in cell wall biosynthesis